MKQIFKYVILCAFCVPLFACGSADPDKIDLSLIPTVETPPTPTPRVQETFEEVAAEGGEQEEVENNEPEAEPTAVPEAESTEPLETDDSEGLLFAAGETVIIEPNQGLKVNFAVESGKQYLLTAYSDGDASLIVYDEQGSEIQTEDGSGFGGSLERLVWDATDSNLFVGAGMDMTFGEEELVRVSVFELGEAQAGPVSRPVAAGEAFLAVAVPIDDRDFVLVLESQTGESSISWIDLSETVEVEVLYKVQDNTISTSDYETNPIESLIYTIPISDPGCCAEVAPMPIAPAAIEPIGIGQSVSYLAEDGHGFRLDLEPNQEVLITLTSQTPVDTHLFNRDGMLHRTNYGSGFGNSMNSILWQGDGDPVIFHPVIEDRFGDVTESPILITVFPLGEFKLSPVELSVAEGETYLIVAKPDGDYNVGLSMSQGLSSFSFADNDRSIEVEVMNEPGDYKIEAVNALGQGVGLVYVMPLEDTICCLIDEE